MNDIEINKEEVTELFEAAKSFSSIKPWGWLGETEIFGVKLPEQEEKLFCSVVGKSADGFGIKVYKGAPGIDSYFKLLNKGYDLEDEIIHISKAYEVKFEDRRAISKEDYELIKSSDVIFRGKNQWPKFLNLEPGFLPKRLNREELLLMTNILKIVRDCCKFLKDNEDMATLSRKNKCYVREYKTDGSFKETIIVYEDVFKNWNKGRVIPKIYNNFDISRLKSIAKASDVTWEMDFFYSLVTEDKQPYFPGIMMIVDGSKGSIIGTHTTDPDNIMEKFQSYFLSFIDKNKVLPSQISISNLDLLMSVEDLCKQLGINVRPVRKLRLIPGLKREYYKLLVDKQLI